MQTRSALVLFFASLSLFACSFNSVPDSGTTNAHQTSGKNAKSGSSSSSGSTGTDDGNAPAATNDKALDGTWDITAAGSDAIGPSAMTIQGNHVTGTIVNSDEGIAFGDGCMIDKSRMTFDMTISGDTLSAKFTSLTAYAGEACASVGAGEPVTRDTTFKATRKHDAKNANGATVVEGDWQILSDEGTPVIAVNIAGLVAKAWDNGTKSGSPVLTTNVNGKDAKNTATDPSLAFAARKR